MNDLVTRIKKGRAAIGVVALAVISVLALTYSTYASKRYLGLHDELIEELKLTIEMQVKANKSHDEAIELIELVEENEKLDEEIRNLIESKLEQIEPQEQEAISAGIKLMKWMAENQDEDGIYCPSCNRKI